MAAMGHLQETGRERIGLWLPDEKYYYSDTQRIAGYRKCNRGEDLVRFGITPENYVREIRSRKLDAVLAYNDVMAAKLTRELLRAGIRIPQDVALVGHDNDDFSEYCYPSLSTIDQKDEAAGQRMFDMMLDDERELRQADMLLDFDVLIFQSPPETLHLCMIQTASTPVHAVLMLLSSFRDQPQSTEEWIPAPPPFKIRKREKKLEIFSFPVFIIQNNDLNGENRALPLYGQ